MKPGKLREGFKNFVKAMLINSIILNVGILASMLVMVANSSWQTLISCYIFLGLMCAMSVYRFLFGNKGREYYIGLVILFSLIFITSHGFIMFFLTPIVAGILLYCLVTHIFVIGAAMLFDYCVLFMMGVTAPKRENNSLIWRMLTGITILISLGIGMIWNRFMQDINVFSYWDVVNNAPFMYWENMILILGVWVLLFNLVGWAWNRIKN